MYLMVISGKQIAYRRPYDRVPIYPSQKESTFPTYRPHKEGTSVKKGVENRKY
jgi:hypothetical protein